MERPHYQPIEGAKTTTADAQVKSGYLEMANVQIVSGDGKSDLHYQSI